VNCRILEKNLPDYLQGSLGPVLRAEMQKHLLICVSCRELIAIAEGKTEIQPDRDFLKEVLDLTSGPACARVRDALCDFIDKKRNSPEDQLVRAHLKGCPECACLAYSLDKMKMELLSQAEMDPGREFAAEVVREFSRAAAERERRNRFSDPWGDRFRRWWTVLSQRPRFAWEAAYIGTILIVLALGNPLSPSFGSFRDLQIRQPASLRQITAQVPKTWNSISGKGAETARTTSAHLLDSLGNAKRTISKAIETSRRQLQQGVRSK
jgi:hypothetical protein